MNNFFLEILITQLHTRKMCHFIENKFFIKFSFCVCSQTKSTMRVSTKLSKFYFLPNAPRFWFFPTAKVCGKI